MKDKLNERILKNFRDSIAISNLKEEYEMKKVIKKQILMFSIIAVMFISGGFLTVNAATGGELANNIKNDINDIKEIFLNKTKSFDNIEVNEDTFELESYDTDENGEIINARYNFKDEKGNWYVIQEGELTENLVTEE